MSSEQHVVEPFEIIKRYNAPRELVYEVWTSVEHLKNWQFPMQGFSCEYTRDDIRIGGSTLHKMSAPNGFTMWLLTKYHELVSPEKIVFTQYNSNENGEIVPNPQMPVWPREIVATVTLTESEDMTEMRFTWQPTNPTAEEAAAFEAARDQMGMGWAGAFETLTNYLPSI